MAISNNERLLASKTAYLSLSLQERTLGLNEIVSDWSSFFGLSIYFWNVTEAEITRVKGNEKSSTNPEEVLKLEFETIINKLIEIYTTDKDGIYIVENVDNFLSSDKLDPIQYEVLKTWLLKIATKFRQGQDSYLVLLGTEEKEWKLQDAFPQLKLPFVSVEEVQRILERRFAEMRLVDYEKTHLIGKAAHILLGLTKPELEWGIRLITNNSNEDEKTVDCYLVKLLEYKIDKLKDLGLEFLPPQEFAEVGGMDILLDHIDQMGDEIAYGKLDNIPMQKGWMLVGVPGSGKSYCAKAMAQRMSLPMIYVSLDSIRSKGSSHLTWILQRVEAAAPNLVYFDEFDKLFPKVKDKQTTAVLGVLLTWLQEKKAHSFALATLNRIDALPPEMLRSGRFDIIWYVGFPQPKERMDIFKLHIRRYDKRFRTGFDFAIEKWVALLNKTINFTGAEIESVVTKTIRHKFRLKMNKRKSVQTKINLKVALIKSWIDPQHLIDNELEYLQNFATAIKSNVSCNPELLVKSDEADLANALSELTELKAEIEKIEQQELIIDYPTLYKFTSAEVSLYKKDPDGVTAIENRAKDVCVPVSSKDTSNLIPKDGTFWSEEPKRIVLEKKAPSIITLAKAIEVVQKSLIPDEETPEETPDSKLPLNPSIKLQNDLFG